MSSDTPSRQRGFSLIEVTLALGIVSFAMVSLLAMIPVGLNSFKQAMDLTVEAQIVQSVVNDIGLRQYSTLATDQYYFDVQGTPTTSATDKAYTAAISFQDGLSNVKSGTTLNSDAGTLAQIAITSASNPSQVRHYTIIIANNGQ
jgi:uncharacterized protein (TIGR02598 family)